MTTSLAYLVRAWKANVVMVSCPEIDLNGRHVMTILENLPANLKAFENVSFSLAADFKGSASGRHCDEKTRWIDGKQIVKGKDDWEKDYSKGLSVADLKQVGKHTDNKQKLAIENSFWSTYWNGLASGALLMGAITATTVRPQNDGDPQQLYLRYMDSPKVRVVIVVSVDGGPVTQVEKAMIPDVVLRTASNINRRSYDWAQCVQFCWCHFPTVVDLVESLDGKLNLSHDTDPTRCVHYLRLTLNHSAVFTVFPGNGGKCDPGSSLLSRPIKTVLQQNQEIAPACLLRAIKHADVETTKFLLSRKANVEFVDGSGFAPMIWACGDVINSPGTVDKSIEIIRLLVAQKASVNGNNNSNKWTPLHAAAVWGAWQSCQLLVELKADVNAKDAHGQTPLTKAKTGPGVERDCTKAMQVIKAAGGS